MKKLTIFSAILIFTSASFAKERLTSQEYIDMWKLTAIEQMNLHGIPASITLAQGILESGSGNSKLAQNANNHFGIKCHKNWRGKKFYQDDDAKDECFRSYSNASQSYNDHSEFLTGRERYAGLFTLKLTDYKGWSKGLKKAGYATNPKYADLLINIIEKYQLNEFDLMPQLPIEVAKEKEQDELTLEVEVDSPFANSKKEEKNDGLKISKEGHSVELNKHRTRYVLVKQGDTFYSISKEFDVTIRQLYRYNELGKRDVILKGEVIYLDPKKSKSRRGENIYICPKALSLREVSQIEGIKLKKILKYNLSDSPDKILPAGTKVVLR